MRFNRRARLDSANISHRGGAGRGGFGGGGMLPTGRGGIGIGGVLVVLLLLVIQQCSGVGPSVVDSGGQTASDTGPDVYDECRTGADANESADCAREAVEISLRSYWTSLFEGQDFRAARIVTFSGGVDTACGQASSAVGPFYCPGDQTIYLDPAFFTDVLQGQLGGQGGDFVEPYVLGHEYGHHIQNVTGEMRNVRTQQGPDSDAVKLELQADCYAGLWTHAAESTTDTEGVAIFEDIDDQDIQEAVRAAYTVGDDHIQQVTQGRVDTRQWTHGSSEERMEWFRRGYESGDVRACDIWR